MEELSRTEAKQLALAGYKDPVLFLKTFLPHWFPGPIPWVHRGILAILTKQTDFLLNYGELEEIVENFVYEIEPGNSAKGTQSIFSIEHDENGVPVHVHMDLTRFTLIMMPRGFSKTTIVNAVNIYRIVYLVYKFFVYVSEANPHAVMQLANVKRELESNIRLISVFGNLKPEQRSGKKWSEEFFETSTGVAMAARGRGGQVRGLNYNGIRPQCITVDDVEDKESVSTDGQRLKTREWAYGDLLPALPELDPEASIQALGTLLHPEALLMTWMKDPDWTPVVFGALDRNERPLWAANMSEDKLAKKRRSYHLAGQLAAYYMEYFNRVRDDSMAKFRQEFFIVGKAEQALQKALAIDPAISNKPGADFCALAVAGIEPGGLIHVLAMEGKVGMTPREQVDTFFKLHFLYSPQKAGVESIAYQAALIHLLREEMFRKKRYFEIIPITHKQKKEERIEGILQPRYAAGYVRHARVFPELETQLLDWPKGKMDFPDALAMCISLLDPYAASASFTTDLDQDNYPPLDEVYNGDWRSY